MLSLAVRVLQVPQESSSPVGGGSGQTWDPPVGSWQHLGSANQMRSQGPEPTGRLKGWEVRGVMAPVTGKTGGPDSARDPSLPEPSAAQH